MRTMRAASTVVRSVLELIAPQRCLACGVRGPMLWCPSCELLVRWLGPGCRRCATPRGAPHACWRPKAPISATVAVADYLGPMQAAVVAAKVRGAHRAWPLLGTLLLARLLDDVPPADVVTWVTTPAVRIRQRGIDHAAALAQVVADGLGIPALRLLDARPQGDKDAYRPTRRLPGTQILLIDDVVTTGATAWRAATALRRAGAGEVSVGALARAGTHELGDHGSG